MDFFIRCSTSFYNRPFNRVILDSAIGASHVTDPGFWFVKESLGIPMNKMFTVYTATKTIAAVVGLVGTLALAAFLG